MQNHDPKEKGIKWGKPYECPYLLCGTLFRMMSREHESEHLNVLAEFRRERFKWGKVPWGGEYLSDWSYKWRLSRDLQRGLQWILKYEGLKWYWLCQGDKGRYLLSGMPQSVILRWNYVCVYNVPISVNSLVGLEKSLNGLWIYNSAWPVGMEMHTKSPIQILLLMKDIKTVRSIRQW